MYKSFDKINRYYLSGPAGLEAWRAELMRRAQGHRFAPHRDWFHNHNPLLGVREPLAWIVERYRPAFDYLDGKRFGRILEIGCAHGLSSFLLKDVADEVWGVDVNPDSVAIGNALFPEVKLMAGGFEALLDDASLRFDLVIDCYGPWGEELQSRIAKHTDLWLHIGYRATKFRHLFDWGNKLKGRHLSFECTAIGPGQRGIAPGYLKYFFSRRYLQHVAHSVRNRYWPQF